MCLVSVNDLCLIGRGAQSHTFLSLDVYVRMHRRTSTVCVHTRLHAACLMAYYLRRGLLRSSDQRAALFPALSFVLSNHQTLLPDAEVG